MERPVFHIYTSPDSNVYYESYINPNTPPMENPFSNELFWLAVSTTNHILSIPVELGGALVATPEILLKSPVDTIALKKNKTKNTKPAPLSPTTKKIITKSAVKHVYEKFSCTVLGCNTTFTSNDYLIKHMKQHTIEKPFFCTLCTKRFVVKGSLDIHMRTHREEKAYLCTYDGCGKTFTQKAHLTSHVKMHTQEKPYSCTRCNKLFAQKNNLTLHMRIHTGEKPYICTRCNKAWGDPSNLNRHILIPDEHPFACPNCHKSFEDIDELNKHMRRHTKKKS